MNTQPTQSEVTMCLSRAAGGDGRAADELLPLVYAELRALAGSRMRLENPQHTLQPTALIHEVYLKLIDQTRAQWKDRAHFFAVAAEAIRRVLVDHARARGAQKRRAPGERLTIHAELGAAAAAEYDLTELDDALQRLKALNEREAKIVELRFFAGLSVEETAQVLGVSEATVKADWRLARAWLQRELSPEGGA